MTAPLFESKAEFARRVGLSRPRITQLCAKGLPVNSDGQVIVGDALAWMSKTLDPTQRVAQARVKAKPALVPPVPDPAGDDNDLLAARTEHEWLKVQRARLALDRERGELLDAVTVKRAVFGRAKGERDALLSWVMRAAPVIAAEIGADAGALHRALDREVRDHLNAMADTPLILDATDDQ